MSELNIPIETIDLPSQGRGYGVDNLLSSGVIDVGYMTARHEDILTNKNYINNGTVIDKLLISLIKSKINYEDLLLGDKDAIMFAVRILGYGKDYPMSFYNKDTDQNEDTVIDLSKIEAKPLHPDFENAKSNNFKYQLPQSGTNITIKLLTQKDNRIIESEIKGLSKIDNKASYSGSTRLKHIITSVDGNDDLKTIREFVDNSLRALDALALRNYYSLINPGINLKVDIIKKDENDEITYTEEGVDLKIGLRFFWPEL